LYKVRHKLSNKGGFVGIYIYKIPKKNHDALVRISNQVTITFRESGMQHFEVFQLGSTENMMDFVNIANTISADQEKEEVWLEVQTFRDRKHVDEVMAKMETNEDTRVLYKQFIDLITLALNVSLGVSIDLIAQALYNFIIIE